MQPTIEGVSRFANLPGLRMHYVEAGPANGAPVILLHGFPEFWYSWRFQIPALAAAGYRVVAPDQRGYNLSGKEDPYDLDTLTRDVANLQDAPGIARSHIVGHDWGGAVAWAFAAAYPARTDRLVVMNAPHLNAYQDTIRRLPRQLLKSWYVAFFQILRLPEWSMHAGRLSRAATYPRSDPRRAYVGAGRRAVQAGLGAARRAQGNGRVVQGARAKYHGPRRACTADAHRAPDTRHLGRARLCPGSRLQ